MSKLYKIGDLVSYKNAFSKNDIAIVLNEEELYWISFHDFTWSGKVEKGHRKTFEKERFAIVNN